MAVIEILARFWPLDRELFLCVYRTFGMDSVMSLLLTSEFGILFHDFFY